MAAGVEKLNDLLVENPYLLSESHHLYPDVQRVLEAASSGGDLSELVAVFETKFDAERKTLQAAFARFCSVGRDSLRAPELKRMNEYLGFPSSDLDIEKLIARIDLDRSSTVDFNEFQTYVGLMGGTMKLFEERRKRTGSSHSDSEPEALRMALLQAGISDDAQAYWRLVVPASEFSEAARLLDCQKSALAHIRVLARSNHDRALPLLQHRVKRLGYGDDALWMTLAWIRELAPVIIHINLDNMLGFLEKDTHYRNQFETKSSGAALDEDARVRWENGLFSGAYDQPGVRGTDRVKYGALNVMNDYRGVVRCHNYGSSYIILKDTRLRCTCSPEDSAAMKAESLAVFDSYAHVLNEYSDAELVETLKVGVSTDDALLGDSSSVGLMKYKEAQIHGEIRFDRHVEAIVVDTEHKSQEARIRAVCKKHGWRFSWMEEERSRMISEKMHKLSVDAWKDRLDALEGKVGAAPEGFCKMACGRRICPGTTRSGRQFTTCCRGCVLGFGHDLLCGKVDASKLGLGLCKFGCGLPVARGRDAKGRTFESCCRGCATGGDHDKTCQQSVPVGAGLCKVGCGRRVHPGKTKGGKEFDTCCKGCISGAGHDATCREY
eukprot:TRINITY_DN61554_c0_g1_i1.p1 TRINITY_DN61554_c0_g1~~TRINITY_DN61554_c0_g1_i1.p1  ORF type:complete len:614 (+),score=88.70 TRINITY_DN61554_c0_g1_i1:24-1844(+)